MPEKTANPAQDVLEKIAAEYSDDESVELRTMFRRPGLRVGGKIFAFLGSESRLIVKVPLPRARELVGSGEAASVTMGERTMREWVSFPLDDDAVTRATTWARAAREAYDYVRSLGQ